MIKTFEQFVNEFYNKPEGNLVNEAFQSSKLRELIKQHGKPKYRLDNKMLYDLKDNEIIDVLNSRDEYWKKYSDDNDSNQETFMLELNDGTIIVIGNLGILKNYLSKWSSINMKKYDEKDKVFKERHAKRHVGNLGNHGDEIHHKHLENVDKIERRRFAEKLQPNIQKIVEEVHSILYEIDDDDLIDERSGNISGEIETEITLNNDKYMLSIYYDGFCPDSYEDYGVEIYNVSYSLSYFEIYNDNICISNEDLGITEKTYEELFKEINRKAEGNVFDPYRYHGVSREDFF